MNHSSTLGFSPHPPVSVYGTDTRNKLRRFSWQLDYPDYPLGRSLAVLSTISLDGNRICLAPSLTSLTAYSVTPRRFHFCVTP